MNREPDAEHPDLAPSAYMVMAMIRDGIDTGYRIKQFLEHAASFFWSSSYGQIYPELRRLESAGMITGRDFTTSGRRRREYSLTDAGAREQSAAGSHSRPSPRSGCATRGCCG